MAPRVTSVLAGLDLQTPFPGPKELERRRGRVYRARLGSNECLFGVSSAALMVLQSHGPAVSMYCDPMQFELRQAIATAWRIAHDRLVIAEGIEGLLGLFVRAFIDAGDVAVTSRGAYPSFDYYVQGCGGKLVYESYLDSCAIDVDALVQAAIRSDAKLLYLANPDNPTGRLIGAPAISELLRALPGRCLLLLDEAYAEFSANGELLPSDYAHPNLVRLRTFSKVYGLAGARVGYAVGPATLIARLDSIRQHFGVSGLALEMASAALEDHGFVADIIAKTVEAREDYGLLARELGIEALPSLANFVAFDFGSRERAEHIALQLDAQDVFVRWPQQSPVDRLIRVTVAPLETRRYFARAMRTAVHSLQSAFG